MTAVAAPLAAVDDLTVVSATEAVATKRIVATDPYLTGHYPHQTIYPGVFIVETARQAFAALIRAGRGDDWSVELTEITSARFTSPLVPGDLLTVRVTSVESDTGRADTDARCANAAGDEVAHLSMTFRTRRETPDA